MLLLLNKFQPHSTDQYCVVEQVLELMARAIVSSQDDEDEAAPLPPPPQPPAPSGPSANTFKSRTLVVYAYHETAESRYNLRFLLKHGADADDASVAWVVVVNGPHTIKFPPHVTVHCRRNWGYDIAAVGPAGSRSAPHTMNSTRPHILYLKT